MTFNVKNPFVSKFKKNLGIWSDTNSTLSTYRPITPEEIIKSFIYFLIFLYFLNLSSRLYLCSGSSFFLPSFCHSSSSEKTKEMQTSTGVSPRVVYKLRVLVCIYIDICIYKCMCISVVYQDDRERGCVFWEWDAR